MPTGGGVFQSMCDNTSVTGLGSCRLGRTCPRWRCLRDWHDGSQVLKRDEWPRPQDGLRVVPVDTCICVTSAWRRGNKSVLSHYLDPWFLLPGYSEAITGSCSGWCHRCHPSVLSHHISGQFEKWLVWTAEGYRLRQCPWLWFNISAIFGWIAVEFGEYRPASLMWLGWPCCLYSSKTMRLIYFGGVKSASWKNTAWKMSLKGT